MKKLKTATNTVSSIQYQYIKKGDTIYSSYDKERLTGRRIIAEVEQGFLVEQNFGRKAEYEVEVRFIPATKIKLEGTDNG